MRGLVYLLEVSITSLVFFGLYVLVLKKLTFFRINRFYLLATLLLSFIIPALQIKVHRKVEQAQLERTLTDPVEKMNIRAVHPIVNNSQKDISIPDLLLYGYVGIALLSLIIGLRRVNQLFKHIRQVVDVGDLKVIYKTSGFVNCSFFNYVFINPWNLTKEETQVLLRHEQVHAAQWHSADKLFLLFCRALLWFNPIVYLYDRELGKVHEFEADEMASGTVDIKAYAHLILKLAAEQHRDTLTHHFGGHPVKERIGMLFHQKSKVWLKCTYVLIVPVLIGVAWLFSCQMVYAVKKTDLQFTLVLDAGHGGKDHGAEFSDLHEKDLNLNLMKKIKTLAELQGLKVITTRDKDETVSLKDRGKIKGDFLISLHCNTSADQSENGIQILASRPESNPVKSSKSDRITYHLYENLKNLEGIQTDQRYKDVTGLYLLDKGITPAVLLELGFISNPSDRDFLTDPGKQTELSKAIVQSVLDYRIDLAHRIK